MDELVVADRAAQWHRLKALVLDSVSSPITRPGYPISRRTTRRTTAKLCRAAGGELEQIQAPFVVSNILIGLEAEGYRPDLSTDAVAMYLLSHQAPDGQ